MGGRFIKEISSLKILKQQQPSKKENALEGRRKPRGLSQYSFKREMIRSQKYF